MSKTFAERTDVGQLPDPAPRSLSLRWVRSRYPRYRPDVVAGVEDPEQSTQAPEQTQAQPASATNSVSGVFRRPGLPVTEGDFTHIREHIKAGQQPWTDWRNKLCADRATNLDSSQPK